MICLLIIFVVIIISFFLALRSMKNYQDLTPTKYPYALFLIKNEQLIHNGMLNKLYGFCLESNLNVSLEKLYKGPEHAIVLYAPQNIGQFVPELELLEIEDYLERDAKDNAKKASVNNVVAWTLKPTTDTVSEVPEDFLSVIPLEEDQQFFWQIVISAIKKEFEFKVNIRVMVVDHDVHRRIDLAKKIDQFLKTHLNMQRKETTNSISSIFEHYKKRTLMPNDVESFILSSQKIKELL